MEGVALGVVIGTISFSIILILFWEEPEEITMKLMIQQDQQTVVKDATYKCEVVTE